MQNSFFDIFSYSVMMATHKSPYEDIIQMCDPYWYAGTSMLNKGKDEMQR